MNNEFVTVTECKQIREDCAKNKDLALKLAEAKLDTKIAEHIAPVKTLNKLVWTILGIMLGQILFQLIGWLVGIIKG